MGAPIMISVGTPVRVTEGLSAGLRGVVAREWPSLWPGVRMWIVRGDNALCDRVVREDLLVSDDAKGGE